MKEELRERRERTWELLVVMGVQYSQTVSRIAEQYGCAESTVKTDISRMESWVGKLDVSYYSGVSRLRELRDARQRLRQYEMQAQQDEDQDLASRINDKIETNLKTDLRISQKLGLTSETPTQVEVGGLDPEDETLLEEWCGIEGEEVDLEDMR
jgi:predicted transcriptional regulator